MHVYENTTDHLKIYVKETEIHKKERKKIKMNLML